VRILIVAKSDGGDGATVGAKIARPLRQLQRSSFFLKNKTAATPMVKNIATTNGYGNWPDTTAIESSDHPNDLGRENVTLANDPTRESVS
jgi:hypothetical protein